MAQDRPRSWSSWLIRGPGVLPDGVQSSLRAVFEMPYQSELSHRLAVTLDYDETAQRWKIWAEDFSLLFKYLIGSDPDKPRTILAFSTAPIAHLRKLKGNYYHDVVRDFGFEWLGDAMEPGAGAYDRRLIRIAAGIIRPAYRISEVQIGKAEQRGCCELFLDPIPVLLDDHGADNCRHVGKDTQETVWALPPLRGEKHPERVAGYFAPDLLESRVAIRAALDIDAARASEPTAVTVNRLVDDPLLRDALIDGGALRVEADRSGATRVALELHVSEDEPVRRSRADLMLPRSNEPPEWAAGLAREIVRDLVDLIPGGRIRATREAQDWKSAKLQHSGGLTDKPGYWDKLRELQAAAGAPGERTTKTMEKVLRVFNPAGQYSHDGAVAGWCSRFWRQSWQERGVQQGRSPWQNAFASLCSRLSFGPADTAGSRGDGMAATQYWWKQFFGHSKVGNRPLTLHYAGAVTPGDILHWRLVYPLGTVIQSGTLVLDAGARSRLDEGLGLAAAPRVMAETIR